MRRVVAVLVLSMAMAGMAAGHADASMSSNTFGPTGLISAHGHRATIQVQIGCTDNGAVRFEVTLTQGDTIGVGHGAGVCTGATETYTVTVSARGETFTTGNATACGDAINREHGGGVDARSWCRAAPVVLS